MNHDKNPALGQFFTPAWACQSLVNYFFPELDRNSCVVEPSCGDGRFLMAIPSHVPAYGVEVDERWVKEARLNSGRTVLHGDFASIDLPTKPTHVIGNPPFSTAIIDTFLDRCYEEMDYGGKIGFILPCRVFQTASRVMDYSRRFSLNQTMIPRNLFTNLKDPLMFARFVKDKRTVTMGLFLYDEVDAAQRMDKKYRYLFIGNDSRASVWGIAVEKALVALGGEAHLQDIYRELEGNRPTPIATWREQIRKVCQTYFVRLGKGVYGLSKNLSLINNSSGSELSINPSLQGV